MLGIQIGFLKKQGAVQSQYSAHMFPHTHTKVSKEEKIQLQQIDILTIYGFLKLYCELWVLQIPSTRYHEYPFNLCRPFVWKARLCRQMNKQMNSAERRSCAINKSKELCPMPPAVDTHNTTNLHRKPKREKWFHCTPVTQCKSNVYE